MRIGLTRLGALVASVSLVVACSSTTVVERADRVAPETPTTVPAGDSGAVDAADQGAEPTTAAEPTAADDSGSGDNGDAGAEPTPSTEGGGGDDGGGFGLGGSEQLESLVADCQGGSDLACDIAFQLSEFDSEDEAVALRCGGRAETDQDFCTEGVERDGDNLWFDDDSPAIPGIADDCEAGDMTSCDFLFFRSAPGSEYEEIGNTCAGRVDVAIPDCRTLLGE